MPAITPLSALARCYTADSTCVRPVVGAGAGSTSFCFFFLTQSFSRTASFPVAVVPDDVVSGRTQA